MSTFLQPNKQRHQVSSDTFTLKTKKVGTLPIFSTFSDRHGANGNPGQCREGVLRLAAGEGRCFQVKRWLGRSYQAGAATFWVGQGA